MVLFSAWWHVIMLLCTMPLPDVCMLLCCYWQSAKVIHLRLVKVGMSAAVSLFVFPSLFVVV
jgi:hypothetical protein